MKRRIFVVIQGSSLRLVSLKTKEKLEHAFGSHRSDEGVMLEVSASRSFYGDNLILVNSLMSNFREHPV